MELVGNLSNAQLGGTQQKRSLHHQELINVIDDRATRNLADHA